MDSFSIWHWVVALSLIGIPLAIGLIIWLRIRASEKNNSKEIPSDIPVSVSSNIDSPNPYAAPRSSIDPKASLLVAPPAASAPRPWVRYWARMFDIYLASIVAGMGIGIIAPNALDVPWGEQLFGIGVIFAWIFIESLLLSTMGTTPGKWLLKMRIVLSSGAKPDYPAAFSRSLKVWWRGLGIGLPLVSLITIIVAYGALTRDGVTSWDRDDGFIVIHERIGLPRVLVAVLFFLGFLAVAFMASSTSA